MSRLQHLTAGIVITLSLSSQFGATLAQVAVPLAVTDVQYDSSTGFIGFGLRNDSTKVVTAWHVVSSVVTDTGSVRDANGFGVDGYLGAEGLSERGRHIDPGESIASRFRFLSPPGVTVSTVAIRPILVIYADGTAIGDSGFVNSIFQLREQAEHTWKEYLSILQESIARSGRSVETLKRTMELLESPLTEDRNNANRNAIINNLRLAITSVERGDDPVARVGALLEQAQRQHAAAAKHVRRKE